MKKLSALLKILYFLFSCSFLSASLNHRRGNASVDRMVSYNALLCSVVDNSFELLECQEKGVFLVCPSSEGVSRLVFSLFEASRIILKVDKMRGWPDGSGVGGVELKGGVVSPLGQAIIDHTRALNEYWCYLEGADLGYSERGNKIMEARTCVLDGIRYRDTAQINRGCLQVRWYDTAYSFTRPTSSSW